MAARLSLLAVAIWLLAAPMARAAEPDVVQINVQAFVTSYFAGMNQQNSGTGNGQLVPQPGWQVHDTGIFQWGLIAFDGKGQFAPGYTAGVRIELTPVSIFSGSNPVFDQINESYLYFNTPYGIVQLGKERGPAFKMHYRNPSVQDAFADVWNLNYGIFNGLRRPTLNAVWYGNITYVDVGRSEKIAYYTPRIGGVQIGASYSPDGCWTGDRSTNQPPTLQGYNPMPPADPSSICGGTIGNGFMNSNNIGQQSNMVGVGINYLRKGVVDVALAGGFLTAQVENNTPNNAFRNQVQWDVGFNLGWNGFIFGGAYQRDNLGTSKADPNYANAWQMMFPAYNPLSPIKGTPPGQQAYVGTDATNWAVGLTYAWSKYQVGANWVGASAGNVDVNGVNIGTDRYMGVELGGGIKLAPGIVLAAGAEWQQWTSGALGPGNPFRNGAQNRGWVFQLGTMMLF